VFREVPVDVPADHLRPKIGVDDDLVHMLASASGRVQKLVRTVTGRGL
jgi:hypothetical protein